jgi:hypothetical protein
MFDITTKRANSSKNVKFDFKWRKGYIYMLEVDRKQRDLNPFARALQNPPSACREYRESFEAFIAFALFVLTLLFRSPS